MCWVKIHWRSLALELFAFIHLFHPSEGRHSTPPAVAKIGGHQTGKVCMGKLWMWLRIWGTSAIGQTESMLSMVIVEHRLAPSHSRDSPDSFAERSACNAIPPVIPVAGPSYRASGRKDHDWVQDPDVHTSQPVHAHCIITPWLSATRQVAKALNQIADPSDLLALEKHSWEVSFQQREAALSFYIVLPQSDSIIHQFYESPHFRL